MKMSISFDCNNEIVAKKVVKVTEPEIKRLGVEVSVIRRGSVLSVGTDTEMDEVVERIKNFAHGACNAIERYGSNGS